MLYDEAFYLSQNPLIASAVANGFVSSGLVHFLTVGHRAGRDPSALFDESDYLLNNPTVAAAGFNLSNAFTHFVTFGQFEARNPNLGRQPSASYDETSYLSLNQDVASAVNSGIFASGFQHYQLFGRFEGRFVFPTV